MKFPDDLIARGESIKAARKGKGLSVWEACNQANDYLTACGIPRTVRESGWVAMERGIGIANLSFILWLLKEGYVDPTAEGPTGVRSRPVKENDGSGVGAAQRKKGVGASDGGSGRKRVAKRGR